MLDVSIVTYENEAGELRALARSLAEGPTRGAKLSIFIHDNSPAPEAATSGLSSVLT